MYIFKIHVLHKWKYIYEEFERKFLGEVCLDYNEAYRICEECGAAQELNYNFESFYWSNINKCEKEILNNKIILKDGMLVLKNKSKK